MLYFGTSGFSYKEWKGPFYPEKLPQKDYLSYYASHFKTTELNNTFYRIPSRKVVESWAGQVPEAFRFALKLNQRITHRKKLKDIDEEMGWFLNGAEALGARLGCILVQLAPWFKQDLDLLESFLERHGKRAPMAFEFRHNSWLEQSTYDLLKAHSAAWVLAETDEQPAVREITGPFVYVRLRKSEYSEEELVQWAEWLRDLNTDAFVYLKHALKAPVWAEQLARYGEP